MSFCKNADKNISKNLSNKYTQTLLDHPRNSAADTHLKLLKKDKFKNSGRNQWFDCNNISGKITSTASQSNPETPSQTDARSIETPKKRYIFPEKR